MAMNINRLSAELKTWEPTTLKEDVQTLRELIGRTIKVGYGTLSDDQPHRVILTANRNHSDMSVELNQQCNGIVLEYPSWEVLAVPPPILNPRFRVSDIKRHLSKYTIYKAQDGTLITMYWWRGEWRYSTSHGYDMGRVQWLGETTYSEAINKQLGGEFDFAQLNKRHCYTFLFRHHEFHPLLTSPEGVWLIQEYDLDIMQPIMDTQLDGVHKQQRRDLALNSADSVNRAVNALLDENTNALQSYLDGAKKTSAPVHYGYVLRGSFSACGTYANIMLESSLLKYVRKCMYNFPKGNAALSDATHANKLEYMVLQGWLNAQTRATFMKLFPQYSDKYKRYDALIDDIASRIIDNMKNKDTPPSTPNTPQAYANLMTTFASHVIGPYEKTTRLVINDFIANPSNIDGLYRIVTN